MTKNDKHAGNIESMLLENCSDEGGEDSEWNGIGSNDTVLWHV